MTQAVRDAAIALILVFMTVTGCYIYNAIIMAQLQAKYGTPANIPGNITWIDVELQFDK